MSCAVLQNFLYNNLILFNNKHNFNFADLVCNSTMVLLIMKPPIVFIELVHPKRICRSVGISGSKIHYSRFFNDSIEAQGFTGLIVCPGSGDIMRLTLVKGWKPAFAFSYVSKHHVDDLTKEMGRTNGSKNYRKPALCVLDWKSMKSLAQKQKIISILQELNLPIARSSNL